jgi:hypothetical protein
MFFPAPKATPKPFLKLTSSKINAGNNLANAVVMYVKGYHDICGIAAQENMQSYLRVF